jgi:hypothetical protein
VLIRDLSARKRTLLYASCAALGVVMVAALASDLLRSPGPDEARTTEARPAERQADTPQMRETRRVEPAPDPSTYGRRQIEQAAVLVGEARRFALDGNLVEAEAALAAAEKAAPLLPETSEARREIAHLSTDKGRFERLLLDARRAIGRDDATTARAALDRAAGIDRDAPQLMALRQQLSDREAELARRSEHVAILLKRMREALARRDFAGAYRAVNEAERIDVSDARIDEARLELEKAEARPR